MSIHNYGLPSLIGSIKMHVHPDHMSRLQAIEDADYSGVARKVREHFDERNLKVDDEYIARGIFALKQYYAIALLDPANAHAVSAPIDPFWHAHILHTEEYMRFCQRVVGEYMHHQPLNRGDQPKLENVRALYEYTLETMGKIFSHADAAFWSTDMSDAAMICYHKGNQELYPSVQHARLFEPNQRGKAHAFEVAA